MEELTAELDIAKRDSKQVNVHLEVDFDDVLGEPDGIKVIECVWSMSYSGYRCGKNCCYKFCSLFTAIFISLFWGCEYAAITFVHVWCLTPGMRLFAMNCNQIQKCLGTITNCIVLPLCETCGIMFTNIQFYEHGTPPTHGYHQKIPKIKVPK